MTHFKAMTFLLVFLFIIQSVLQGCTVLNYHIGKDFDIAFATRYEETNIEDIKRKDIIDIIFKDDSFVRGELEYLNMNSNVRIRVIFDKVENDNFQKYETFDWNEIKEIKVVKVRKGYRSCGLLFGAMFDLGIAFLLIYANAMAGISQGLGN